MKPAKQVQRPDPKHRHRRPDPKRNGDSKHEAKLDTVAQKPTHVGSGAPTTEKQVNAHHDAAQPTPGAQPPVESTARLGESEHVAAGMKAIFEGSKFTFGQMGPLRGLGTWLKVNKKDGFDCQSCAWPSPDGQRHMFEFCENGTKAFSSEATKKHADAAFFRAHSIAQMREQSDYWLEQQGRLVEPMVKRAGATHYKPISWDDAFQLLADELHALPSPDATAFYTSGRTSNEAAFLYQLFARQFGTNNLPDCSNMCHESSGAALSEAIGIGKGCVTLADLEQAGAIFILGQNPGTNHPRMLTALEQAKRNGAKIVG